MCGIGGVLVPVAVRPSQQDCGGWACMEARGPDDGALFIGPGDGFVPSA